MIKKISYGIVCFRRTDKGIEIIMVKKSTTHHFCTFVAGQYKKYQDNILVKLFNNMTYHEKMDILSLNFANMWYRIYKENPEHLYNDRKEKLFFDKKFTFENNFRGYGANERLKKLIAKSCNVDTPWEFPKGRNNADESNIETAIREFKEETGINDTQFKMLWHVKPYIETYTDFKVVYQNIYYFAEAIGAWEPEIKFYDKQQISEISAVSWISKNNLLHMKLEEMTHKRLLNAFNKIIKKYKNAGKTRPIKVAYENVPY